MRLAGPIVTLSTSSVYPEATLAAFELAKELGYDGIEVMVGTDSISSDTAALKKLSADFEIPITSIHAPCLLVTATVWGVDPVKKLQTSLDAAKELGTDLVVVHPPFRWQRNYAANFIEIITQMQSDSQIRIAVENMYPWRGPLGADMRAYAPDWDPTNFDWDCLTLDLSHASVARQSSLELVEIWGDRLAHVHLTDGRGFPSDDHMLPGQGDQQVDKVLHELAARGYQGHVVMEIRTRSQKSRAGRAKMLGDALAFTKQHLGLVS